jgi:hypothetical protein
MRALLGVALALALAGSAAASTSESPLFRRANGAAIVFPGAVRAWCDRTSLNVMNLATSIRQSRWQLEIPRRSVRPGGVIRFGWRHPHRLGIFVYDGKTRNEASQGTEGSRGFASLRRATCRRRGSLAIALSGTIGSEFSDGTPVRVSGTYRGTVGSSPGQP